MPRSGFLRRVAILLAFAWFYARFVLGTSQFIQDPEKRLYLRWFLYAATVWGIITLLSDRLPPPRNHDGGENDDD